MKPDAQREAALFQAAAQLTGTARSSFLDNACKGDGALRRRLDALLEAHEQSEGVLDEAAPVAEATMKVDFTDPADEAIGQRIGRYKILEKVGEGGCGVVYVAEQTEPVRRRVALKVIKLGMDTKQVVARFEAERQALAMMDHPNIAKVLDANSTETGRPYFVMELVRGIKITEYCDQNNLATKDRLNLFVKICHAIQHAHQKGIIHRDIKPSNILVTLHDGVPVPKVIDFGIAKATEGRLTDATVYTRLHQFIGTPAYMSPEQAEMSGLDVDTRSDIYSLGVLLYELLTGKTPFDGTELMSRGIEAMRKTIREQEPARPSTKLATLHGAELTTTAKRRSTDTAKLLHQLKGDLDWIAMKCLEKDRTRRYETANGLAADIGRHLNNEPVVARPPSAAYKFQKAFRRNKLVFAGTAAVLGILAVGIVVSGWQAIRAKRAEQVASQQRALAEQEAHRAEGEAARAEEARKIADRETISARRAAAQADARFLLQERLLPDALVKATEAFKLGGEWEDGLLIHQIAAAARNHWVLAARVPLGEPAPQACVASLNNRACLLMSDNSGLRLLDCRNGALLGSGPPFPGGVRYLYQGLQSNSIVVVSQTAISILALPSLTVTTTKALPASPVCAAVGGGALLLVLQSHDAAVFDLQTLSETSSFNWDQNPVSKDLRLPRYACVSPDGKLALFHGGSWNMPALFWDRRKDSPRFSTNEIVMQQFQFVDDSHLAAWYMSSPSIPDADIRLYDLQEPVNQTSYQVLPNDDTKGSLQMQVWGSKSFGYRDPFPILGLVGPAGVVLKSLGSRGQIAGNADFALSDRYSNLLPTDTETLSFLTGDLSRGVLVLQGTNDALIFRLGGAFWDGQIEDYCATACRDGLLCLTYGSGKSARLFFIPFDPRRTPSQFNLQGPADSTWLPWAIAATPDASTFVIIAQESDSKLSIITTRYNRIRALVYRPGNLKTAPGAWPIQNAFELDAPTGNGWVDRFATLDPDARALVYWASATTATRYDPRDGKPLGTLELGLVAARSRDGRRVAAVSPTGQLRVHDVASGEKLLELPGHQATALCFSTDGSQLVASYTNRLVTYDISSGRELSSIESRLRPLAYPSKGDRFLAFEPDASGPDGSLVLAGTADAHVAAVLSRTGNAFTPAFFSDSGEQFSLVRDRWFAEVIRSLRPDELPAVLTAGIANATLQTLPPTNLVTAPASRTAALSADNIPLLLSRLGNNVTLEGRVRDIKLTFTHNAANIHFVVPELQEVTVWVPPDTYPKLVAALGENLDAVLNDRTIRATGRLSKYKEILEVTLDDPAKLELVTAEAKAK